MQFYSAIFAVAALAMETNAFVLPSASSVGRSVVLSVANPITKTSEMPPAETSKDGGGNGDDDNRDLLWPASPSPAAAFAVRSVSLAFAANNAKYDLFESLLTSGGDDRTLIDPTTGKNKYHIRPRPIDTELGDIFRGSCTGNPPTARGFDAARRLYDEFIAPLLSGEAKEEHDEGDEVSSSTSSISRAARLATRLAHLRSDLAAPDLDDAVRSVMSDQRNRLSKLLNLPNGAEVLLCPSGSDAEYLPLAVARTLMAADDRKRSRSSGKSTEQKKKEKTIVNGVTQFKEVGAGTSVASVGRYFSSTAPLLGDVAGFEVDTPPPHLSGFGPTVVDESRSHIVAARRADGTAEKANEEMKQFVNDHCSSDNTDSYYPIVHGVFGGKTGLRDAHCADMPTTTVGKAGATSLTVVDACQGRFTADELASWLSNDSLVLFTSSKFYQGPPFCGAVILPPGIAARLADVTVEDLLFDRDDDESECVTDMFTEDGLGAFLTDKELPPCLECWHSFLAPSSTRPSPDINVGLALRWESGLAGMEALSDVDDDERDAIVADWAGAVEDMVKVEGGNGEHLDAWWIERSIVSIRVARRSAVGEATTEWMGMGDLRKLYAWMSEDVSGRIQGVIGSEEDAEALSKIAYIGQPVDVSESHGIVRIALGAESMLSYRNDNKKTLEEDRWVVKKMAAIAKHFEALDNYCEDGGDNDDIDEGVDVTIDLPKMSDVGGKVHM